MAITVYQGSHGRQYTFTLYEKDGITPRDLTNLIVIWRLKAIDDPNTILALNTTITDPTHGEFYVVMDVSLSNAVRDWDSQFEVSNNIGQLLDPSEYILVNVLKSTAIAG